ncbi:MAG: YHYH protein [Arenicellales bacterium]|nr:YHYH protein [Arenicellales bacterium]
MSFALGWSSSLAGEELEKYSIGYRLCEDTQGPNCQKLRLGDRYYSTQHYAKGYLYACRPANPNAPGSIESRITWIDFDQQHWNFLEKPWLPSGTFTPEAGTYREVISQGRRQIQVNNLPVDRKIGDWPMTQYAELTRIDRNPGVPMGGRLKISLPIKPTIGAKPTCVPTGAIGVTRNGVVLYNASDGRGEDAVAREITDRFGGHPARDEYHYHFVPERLDAKPLANGHSGLIGWIIDGFPLYGYRGVGGIEMANAVLDQCHGHEHDGLGYHYHATIEYPYTVGCFRGAPLRLVDRARPSNSTPEHLKHSDSPRSGGGVSRVDPVRAVADELGLSYAALRRAVGPPPPNIQRAARRLGVDASVLRQSFERHRP